MIKKVIKLEEIKLLGNRVLVTAETYNEAEIYDISAGGIAMVKSLGLHVGAPKDYQTIVSLGDMAQNRGLEPGQVVKINYARFVRPKQTQESLKETFDEMYRSDIDYIMNTIEVDGILYYIIFDNDIEFIASKYQVIEEDSNLEEIEKAKFEALKEYEKGKYSTEYKDTMEALCEQYATTPMKHIPLKDQWRLTTYIERVKVHEKASSNKKIIMPKKSKLIH